MIPESNILQKNKLKTEDTNLDWNVEKKEKKYTGACGSRLPKLKGNM